MSSRPNSDEIQRREHQEALIRVLSLDLETAHSLLDSAQLTTNSARIPTLLEKARKALETIHLLMGRIEDPVVWEDIYGRTNTLEDRIAALSQKQ